MERRMTAISMIARKEPGENPECVVRDAELARPAKKRSDLGVLERARCAQQDLRPGPITLRETSHNREMRGASPVSAYWQGAEWLQQQRLEHNSDSMCSGRTGARATAGKAHPKWHDGAAAAREMQRAQRPDRPKRPDVGAGGPPPALSIANRTKLEKTHSRPPLSGQTFGASTLGTQSRRTIKANTRGRALGAQHLAHFDRSPPGSGQRAFPQRDDRRGPNLRSEVGAHRSEFDHGSVFRHRFRRSG